MAVAPLNEAAPDKAKKRCRTRRIKRVEKNPPREKPAAAKGCGRLTYTDI